VTPAANGISCFDQVEWPLNSSGAGALATPDPVADTPYEEEWQRA
jgi:hypothetical protein